jgi:hypothetical protein
LLSRLDPTARRLVLRLPVAAAGALLLWFLGLATPWGQSVIAVAETSIRAVERPTATLIEWHSPRVVTIRRSDFGSRSGLPGFDPAFMTANLVLLLALWWATPGAASPPLLKRAAACIALLFLSHVVHVIFTVEATWATKLGAWSVWRYPRWQREFFATANYFFDIVLKYALPFALWGTLLLVPALQANEAKAAAKESSPRPHKPRKKKR